jgi:hypothetical protein
VPKPYPGIALASATSASFFACPQFGHVVRIPNNIVVADSGQGV